jgi:hypothetical protein
MTANRDWRDMAWGLWGFPWYFSVQQLHALLDDDQHGDGRSELFSFFVQLMHCTVFNYTNKSLFALYEGGTQPIIMIFLILFLTQLTL